MATLTSLNAAAYTQVAADVTVLKLIQCPGGKNPLVPIGIELVVASSLPAVTVRGIELASGETIVSGNISDLGASGALYAKPIWDNATGEILTL